MDEVEKFSDVSVQILQRECEALNKDVEILEKQLKNVVEEKETYQSNAAIISAEIRTIAAEHKNIKEVTSNLSEEMHNWDTIVRQPLMHYKDMKQALEELNKEQKMLQKYIMHVDVNISDTEKAMESARLSQDAEVAKTTELMQQAAMENKGTITTLQTQLKLIETRKKAMESQLHQKTEENKELTKICEELIKQRE